MSNSVDPDQTAPIGAVCSGSTLFASILNTSVMLGNFLQQTASADDVFRCIYFLGALRVNTDSEHLLTLCMLGNFSCFRCSLLTFSKVIFFKKFFQCQTVWIQIRTDNSVGPALGSNCLQWLSADDKSRSQQGKS